jgi:chromosome partitioning protein
MMTVYELDKPIGTARTHKRCRSNLDGVMAQVEDLIRRPWHRAEPSFAKEQVDVA